MTKDELLSYEANTPVRLADGNFGLLIRYGDTAAGVQVPGEDAIPLTRLIDLGNGALQEQEASDADNTEPI